MRKKLLALTLVCLSCLCVLAACSSNDTETGELLTEENYRTWTKADWDKASETEQTAAARFVLTQVGDSLMDGFSDLVKQAESDPEIASELNEEIETMRVSISSYFDSAPEDSTLDSLIEQTQSIFEQ